MLYFKCRKCGHIVSVEPNSSYGFLISTAVKLDNITGCCNNPNYYLKE